jgi:hypothetical protein
MKSRFGVPFLFLLATLLLSNSVLGQTSVQVEPIQKPSIWSDIAKMIFQYSTYIIMAFVLILLAVFIYLIWKQLKLRIDPFKQEWVKIKKLSRFHKNNALKSVYLVSNSSLRYLGHYWGDCLTQDGYRNILIWAHKKWYLFWVPTRLDFLDLAKDLFIVRTNENDVFYEKVRDPQTKAITVIERKTTKGFVFTDGDKLVIKAHGIEPLNYFFYPILKNESGNVVDSSLEIFEREKNPALINVMYNMSEDFANVVREVVNLNPRVRFHAKTGEGATSQQN